MIAGLTGCGTKKSAGITTEINVGYFNNVTHAQALYMKAQGTLDKAFDGKAAVKWTSFIAGPSEVEALFSGNIDIGYASHGEKHRIEALYHSCDIRN